MALFRQPVDTEDAPDDAPAEQISTPTPKSLADKVRAKYPGKYDDMKDDELEKAVVAKHPQYKDLASTPVSQPSTLKKIWGKISEPLTEAPTRFAEGVSKYIRGDETSPIRNIGAAYVESLGHAVSGLTSPLNIGLTTLSGGSSLAAESGLPRAASALNTGARVLSAPVAAEGAKDVYGGIKDRDFAKTLSGGLELAGGALGMRSGVSEGEVSEEPPIRRSKEIPYRTQGELPSSETPELSIRQKALEKASITTAKKEDEEKPLPIRSPNLSAQFSDQVEEAQKAPTQSPEDKLYDDARQRFKMGLDKPPASQEQGFVNPFDKPSKPTAEYAYDGPEGRMYNIKGGEGDKSTVSESELTKRGIDIPKVSDEDIVASGKARDAAIAKQKGLEAPEEQPTFARSEQGGIKIGQNIKRSAQELTTGYSNPLEGVMVREGMQNAIDAVRHQGGEGKINAKIDEQGMHISDTGKGMSRKDLETVFSNLHESGKTTEAGATGGKGIGKATYILGGDKFRAETVVFEKGQKIKRTIEGTPDEFSEHVPIKEEVVPLSTPTGTSIHTDFKKGQDAYNARNMLSDIRKYSRGIESKITPNVYGVEEPETGIGTPTQPDVVIGSQKINGHDVKISIPADEKTGERNYLTVKYSNNGMYQFSKSHYIGNKTDHMPENIIVDVHPNAEEGTPEYPFPTQRESLKDTMQEPIDAMIKDKLINPQQQAKKTKLKELYASMTTSKGANTVRKPVMYDPGNRLTSGELNTFNNSPVIRAATELFDRAIDNMLKMSSKTKWSDRLEGVGIVLDPNMHGVHIPNPETGKSTILINPFINISEHEPADAALNNIITGLHEVGHIGTEDTGGDAKVTSEDLKDPRIGTYLQSYLTQVITHGGLDPGHNVGFIKRLGQIYADYGPKRTFEEADNLTKIYTDNTGGYNREVQKLLQIYKDSRGREAVTEDLLSGTGDKQKSSGTGEKPIPGGNQPDGKGASTKPTEEDTSNAVNKLFNAMGNIKENRVQQDLINKREQARRFADFASVKDEGMVGAAKSLSALKGEFEKVDLEKLQMKPKEADSLFTAVKNASITNGEKARGYTALFKLLNGDKLPQRGELAILDNVFGNGFASHIIDLHGGIGAVGIKLAKLNNTAKSLENSLSLAAPLRHGLALAGRAEFYPAMRDMFKFFANKDTFNAAMDAITSHPDYIKYREAGGFFSKSGSVMDSEEQFLDSYISDLPKGAKGLGIRNLVESSQRGYVGFLNKLRFDTYKGMTATAEKLGNKLFDEVKDEDGKSTFIPSKEARAITKFINTATGRGDMGALNKITNEMNLLFFSPRRIYSQVEMLNPKMYTNLPKGMRLEGLKSLLAISSLGIGINTLGVLGGAKISNNILSSDFMKSRFGTHVIDPWGSYQQLVVAAARLIAGKTISNTPTSRLDILGRFAANKESPAASFAHTLLTAKKFTGKTDDPMSGGDLTTEYGQKTSVQSELGKKFVPILIQDLSDIVQSDPNFSENIGLDTALLGASVTGMAQDYPEPKSGKFSLGKLR